MERVEHWSARIIVTAARSWVVKGWCIFAMAATYSKGGHLVFENALSTRYHAWTKKEQYAKACFKRPGDRSDC